MSEDESEQMMQNVVNATDEPVIIDAIAVINNQTWMEWIGAIFLWFVYATIQFVHF